MNDKTRVWLKGLLAGGIAGAAGGVVTGFAAVGIDPEHFNLVAGHGLGNTVRIVVVACVIHAILGTAMYLQKSPLPE